MARLAGRVARSGSIAGYPARRATWAAFDRLDTIDTTALGAQQDTDSEGDACGLPFLRFDDDAREAFGDWRRDLEATIKATDNELLEGALSKFRHHAPALALVLHALKAARLGR